MNRQVPGVVGWAVLFGAAGACMWGIFPYGSVTDGGPVRLPPPPGAAAAAADPGPLAVIRPPAGSELGTHVISLSGFGVRLTTSPAASFRLRLDGKGGAGAPLGGKLAVGRVVRALLVVPGKPASVEVFEIKAPGAAADTRLGPAGLTGYATLESVPYAPGWLVEAGGYRFPFQAGLFSARSATTPPGAWS